jgi:hypothetical protein
MPISKILSNSIQDDLKFKGKGTGLVADTSSNRSNSPSTGDMRFNTTVGKYELYNGAKWQTIDPSEISMAMSIALGG